MNQTWKAPLRPPWSTGQLNPKRDSEHLDQEVSEATIKFALENFDAALQYFHDHAMEEFDLEWEPPLPGDYGRYDSGRRYLRHAILQAVDDLSEVTPELVQGVIAANTPPLPKPDAVPGLLEWAVTHVRAHMIREAMYLITGWLGADCKAFDTAGQIGMSMVEIAKKHLYEIDAPLADWVISAVSVRTNDDTCKAFFDWIRNNERSDQWMIWRVNGEYWYDDNQEINYGPRPETKSN